MKYQEYTVQRLETNGWSYRDYGTFWTTCVHKALRLAVGVIEMSTWISGSSMSLYRNAEVLDRDQEDVFISYEAELTFAEGHVSNILSPEGTKVFRHPIHYSLFKVTHRDPKKFTEHIPSARFMG